MDVSKQIEYWRSSAQEDWDVASKLVKEGSARHGLFFAHLALEKVLKAIVCRNTNDIAPRIHNLTRLSVQAGLTIASDLADVLADMNQFNIEGRYPGSHMLQPSKEEALGYVTKCEEVLAWLNNQF